MKISQTVLPVILAEHLQILEKICFICNDKCISDSITYNKAGIEREGGRDCVDEHLRV